MVDLKRVARGFGLLVGILFFLYFFLVGLDLLGSSFKIIAGDSAGSLFTAVANPFAGLMVGILATVMVQSSSTTTSVVVAAVGSGVLEVQAAIPMIMGANIGTSVTNTIVSMGFIGNKEDYRRGFAGATVHDMFNYLNVCFWFPVELIINAINGGNGGPLFLLSEVMVGGFDGCDKSSSDCEKWEGPLKKITSPLSSMIVKPDKDVTKDFAIGRPSLKYCNTLCSSGTKCSGFKFNSKRCYKGDEAYQALMKAGVVPAYTSKPEESCKWVNATDSSDKFDKKSKAKFNYCALTNGTVAIKNSTIFEAAQDHYDAYKMNVGGVFYKAGWSDEAAGYFTLVLSLIMLIVCLIGLVKTLGIAVRGQSEEWLKKSLNMNGYLAILVGCGITVLVQSSSITTSTLTPLCAMGTLTLEGMLPLTLGANIGTTFTGIMAALVGSSKLGMQIALVHFLFNIFGVIMFYPIPRIRAIPLNAARRLGGMAAKYKLFPLFYILMLFVFYPGFFLLISMGFTDATGGEIAGATIGLIFFIFLHVAFFYWYWRKDGKAFFEKICSRKKFEDDDDKADLEKQNSRNKNNTEGGKKDPQVGITKFESNASDDSTGTPPPDSGEMQHMSMTQA